ncbi:MAG: biotin--[acetyl-CoA-carboxylase] ligase [Nitrospinota bacterium]
MSAIVWSVRRYGEVDSTNTVALELARGGCPEGTVVTAESQSRGRGRMGRSWFSPVGTGLYLSAVLRPGISADILPPLTLVAGVASAEAAERVAGIPVRLKWPNDLRCGEKKVGGILAELEREDGPCVVLGVGLNVNTAPAAFPPELSGEATSLRAAAGRVVNRESLLQALLECLDRWYGRLQAEGFGPVRERWRQLSQTLGRRVRVALPGGGRVEGLAEDIDERGRLVVRAPGGERVAVDAGDVMEV